MNRPNAPPPMSFFAAARPPGGGEAFRLELADLTVRIDGLDADLRDRLLERYAPYAALEPRGPSPQAPALGQAPATGLAPEVGQALAIEKVPVIGPAPAIGQSPALAQVPALGHPVAIRHVRTPEPEEAASRLLHVTLSRDERDYFIDPPPEPENNPVLLACDGSRVRYLGYRLAGWFDAHGGRGQILLAKGEYEPDLRAIENYVRAAVAWQAASLGGALVHAASAVWQGRGYLFYGPSGAGKSTLSACNTRASVLSDDLSLVLPRVLPRAGSPGGSEPDPNSPLSGLDLAGSPFRGTYTGGPPVLGRFPLVAGFRIVKDARAEVRSVPRVRVFAELVANLPFVADAFPQRPDLFEQFERTFAPLPLYHLHFCKDDSYWDVIGRAGV